MKLVGTDYTQCLKRNNAKMPAPAVFWTAACQPGPVHYHRVIKPVVVCRTFAVGYLVR